MVRLAQKEGIKPTARLFRTTPKTVRKWVRRYQEQGYQGLKDQSRAPKYPARHITAAQRRKAVRMKEYSSWGPGPIILPHYLARRRRH